MHVSIKHSVTKSIIPGTECNDGDYGFITIKGFCGPEEYPVIVTSLGIVCLDDGVIYKKKEHSVRLLPMYESLTVTRTPEDSSDRCIEE